MSDVEQTMDLMPTRQGDLLTGVANDTKVSAYSPAHDPDGCGFCRLSAELREARAALDRVRAELAVLRESTATGHPDCSHDEDCVACAADDIDRALATPAPADAEDGA